MAKASHDQDHDFLVEWLEPVYAEGKPRTSWSEWYVWADVRGHGYWHRRTQMEWIDWFEKRSAFGNSDDIDRVFEYWYEWGGQIWRCYELDGWFTVHPRVVSVSARPSISHAE